MLVRTAVAAVVMGSLVIGGPQDRLLNDGGVHVIDSVDFIVLHVRNEGCPPPGAPFDDDCPAPGAPTTAMLEVVPLVRVADDSLVVIVPGAGGGGGIEIVDRARLELIDSSSDLTVVNRLECTDAATAELRALVQDLFLDGSCRATLDGQAGFVVIGEAASLSTEALDIGVSLEIENGASFELTEAIEVGTASVGVEDAELRVSGGVMDDSSVVVRDDGRLTISGGDLRVQPIEARGANSSVVIEGGGVSGHVFAGHPTSVVTIVGENFTLAAIGVSPQFAPIAAGEPLPSSGILRANLPDGSLLDVTFHHAGSLSYEGLIRTVPEPDPRSALCLSLVVLATLRRLSSGGSCIARAGA